jgi:nucleoside-diphosphate-sugar epimerase
MELPQTIGVTGAAGFIGSHLCERLLADGRGVVGVDNLSHGTLGNLEGCLNRPGFRFVEMDCCDRRGLGRAFAECRAIVHLAGEKIPRYGGAVRTLEANVDGANSVYATALVLDAHVVLASTSDVYGNTAPPLREDAELTLGPSTTRRWAYATSKLYDEHLALALAEERGLRVTILRLFGCYGPHNHPSWWGGPQAAFIERLLDGEEMEIHGDGRQMRTFTFVDETVTALVLALDTPDAVGEIINVGAGKATPIAELAEAVQRAVGVPGALRAVFVPYESIGGRYQDVRHRAPDTDKAHRLLGFRATMGLEQGLPPTVAWHRRRREGAGAGSGQRALQYAARSSPEGGPE